MIFAPLIPVAIGMMPILEVTGLDAKENAKDESKAGLVYRGMSEEDLRGYVGEPKDKYLCKDINFGDYEVWIYGKDQVLRGGRELYIDLDDNTVYYNSVRIPFDKMGDKKRNNCSLVVQ